MQMRRIACVVIVCCLLIGTTVIPASATEVLPLSEEQFQIGTVNPLATNSFSITIPANSKVRANSSFSMMVGETITIKASYAPFSSDVDIGFIAPDGRFYYFKSLAEAKGIPYQTLINLYLRDCADNQRQLQMSWQ